MLQKTRRSWTKTVRSRSGRPGNDGNAGGKSIVLDDGKQVKENNVSIGETVHFRLQINTSNYVADKQIKEFIIEDTLPTGFDAAKITSVMIEEEPLEQFENTTFPVTILGQRMKEKMAGKIFMIPGQKLPLIIRLC